MNKLLSLKKECEFTLILPCYNEEENLKKTVETSVRTLSSIFKTFEIIIIEDNSFDQSPKIAKQLAKKYSPVRVIHNPINLGQGISFLIGLQLANGRLVMQNGIDRPFNLRDLKKILHFFPLHDIVIIARNNRSAYSIWRKITSVCNNILRGIFFGFKFNDLNFVQIYKRKVIKKITVQARSAAFSTQELILAAEKAGYRICEVKLPYYKRIGGNAHHGKRRDVLWALIDMFNYWWENKKIII